MRATRTWHRAERLIRRDGCFLLLAVVVAGAPACVSGGKYKQLEAQRTALEAENDALEVQVGELGKKLGKLEDLNRELDSELQTRSTEMALMKGTHDSLVRNLEAELAAGQVQIEQLSKGIRVNVAEEILFPSGSANLNQQGSDLLSRVAADLKAAGHQVEVLGHTDNVVISGRLKTRYPTNWELGAARAARVVRLFQEQGIDGARLAAVSRGPFAPIVSNETEEGRARNRRIEIRLMPVESAPAAPVPF